MYRSLREIQNDLQSRNTTLNEVVHAYLKNIENHKGLNAFLEVWNEEAELRAGEIQNKIIAGNAGRLAGMVIAIKDNICYRGHKVSASSKILGEFESLFSSTSIERLLAEDAIIIGRTNCDEFAMGGSNENSAFGPVLNPFDNKRVPGGSSGGSAAAVSAGLCLAALGSDTGGSIRQPASFCGIVGFKPTYGRVSRYGLIAYASSFDQIGPLTHNVEDAALLYEIMAGQDEHDSTLSKKPVEPVVFEENPDSKKKIAFIKESLGEGTNPQIKDRMNEIILKLKNEGHEVNPISFPFLDFIVPTYYMLTTAEASSNLSRFDGMRYGFRSNKAKDIESTYIKSRSEGFGEEVKRRIMLGTFVLSAGYYDAYFAKAQKVRRIIRNKTLSVLDDYDFLLSPTTPTTAFNVGENITDPIQMYLQDIFTVQANLTGIPAISLPLGIDNNNLPFGVQLMAAPFKDSSLLSFSEQLNRKFAVKLPMILVQ